MAKLNKLTDEKGFRETLALDTAQAWKNWTANFPNVGQKAHGILQDGAPMFRSVTQLHTNGSQSRPSEKLQALDLVAAGHASAGGCAILLEKDALGIPANELKKLDEEELETLERLWKLFKTDSIMRFVPKFEGIVEKDDKRYLRMSYLLRPFRRARVLDVNIGTRTWLEKECDNKKLRPDLLERMKAEYPDQVTAEEQNSAGVTKLRFMRLRDAMTTIGTLGFRIDGIAGSRPTSEIEDWSAHIKKVQTFKDTADLFRAFIEMASEHDHQQEGVPAETLAQAMLEKLREIRKAFATSSCMRRHECIGSSLLLVADAFGQAGVFWIDFGKTRLLPEDCHVDHNVEWQPGSHEDGVVIGLTNMVSSWQTCLDSMSRIEDPLTSNTAITTGCLKSCISQ